VSLNALGASQQVTGTVRDQNDQPIAGLALTFVTADPAVATVSSSGLVKAEGNGSTTVTVSHGSVSAPVAVAVSQVVTQVTKTAGDQQSGQVATQLATAVEVELRDAGGNPVPGGVVPNATVQFTAANGGSVTDLMVTANASGRASTTWTLGTGAGTQQVTVSLVGGAATTQFSATATAGAAVGLTKVSGDNQNGTTDQPLIDSIVVQVVDQFGNPTDGPQTDFTVTLGGGSASPVSVDLSSGRAATRWTLGSTVGPQTMEASGIGSAVTFSATGVAIIPTTLVKVEGDVQTGLVSAPVNIRPAVRVADQLGNGIAGQQVTFTVTGGGGSAPGSPATTDASGVARPTDWTLGSSAGANTLEATSGALTPVTFTATGATAGFNITLRYLTTPTGPQEAAFDSAKAKWERLIFGELTDIPVNIAANDCDAAAQTPALNETVDDLLIFVKLEPIDGVGNVLGSARPCLIVRSADSTSIIGIMRFDTADLASLEANGQLDEVVTHEMGHVLGYGSLWFLHGFFADTLTADPIYTGGFGRRVFDEIGGTSYTGGNKVPVENTGGSGTKLVHWRETTFDEELMTGILELAGTVTPLSRLSAASMVDLNYFVTLSASESYNQTFSLRFPSSGQIPLTEDNIIPVLYAVDAAGRVTQKLWPR
jgi:hypothetical protein